MKNQRGMLFVVSGFSGSGKGTVLQALRSRDDYALSVSCTSRKPREGEVDGREYYFISHEEFVKRAEAGYFLEHAIYTDFGYGTPADFVEENLSAGKDVILEIELQGAMQVREKYPDTVLIFITAPSAESLKQRLINRKSDSLEQIRKRLRRAVVESQEMDRYDFILVNDDLETCIEELHQLMKSMHKRSDRNIELIEQLRNDLPLLQV